MSMDRLFDPVALLLVIGGTLAATIIRSGREELRSALAMLAALFRRRFSDAAMRAQLAVQVQQINANGLLRADLHPVPDGDVSGALSAMFQHRSLTALADHHAVRRQQRERIANEAGTVLNLAADLSPVFGLAGTLVAMAQLPVAGIAPEAISGVVSSAVLTTLYGILSANLIYAPLARQVVRRAAREEVDRQALLDWLCAQIQIAPFAPPAPPQRVTG